jgi:hypothetical protein
MAVRAILLDEHTMSFSGGLVSILSSCEGGIEVLGHSPTGEETLALLHGRTARMW